MIDFFNRLFGRQTSGATAKERLRLVLMSDHLSLAPEMIEAMKRDLVDVISKYVEVDRDKIDVHFEHEEQRLAMLANIPITGVNRSGGNGSGTAQKRESPAPEIRPSEIAEAPAVETEASTNSSNGNGQRRRKRRKSGQHQSGPAQTGSPAPAT